MIVSILVLLAVISFWDALEQLKKQEVPLSEEVMAYCILQSPEKQKPLLLDMQISPLFTKLLTVS